MKTKNRRLRSCALVLALSTVFLTSGAALADLTRSFTVGVNGCNDAATQQLCTPVPTLALPTDGVLRVQFVASDTHCSPIIAHLLIDGGEPLPASSPLAPGQGTGVVDFGPIAAGVHAVGVQGPKVSWVAATSDRWRFRRGPSRSPSLGSRRRIAAIAAPGLFGERLHRGGWLARAGRRRG
jgi:hypothetical protein